MSRAYYRTCYEVSQVVHHMDLQHWVIAFAGVILVGVVFLRGFGPRSHF